jgi:hypothetical protein
VRLLEQTTFALQEGTIHGQLWLPASARREEQAYTERLRSSLMALISIFLRPMMNGELRRQRASKVEGS